ncbi:hypothetical protein [Paenarthrobacter ilicis]|uniref:Lipoprotein n=1 Tax=Paenarthrobacter ilicis TaxID=43665 RepID=A0ABX0TM89_9MICC|nr:hypothetical protein [Paenarthrobacter ilicis]MBM7794417.1 hypothetical protein [Paenarthrobacter ilicis]NIJ02241.1 hypothetical protein [Paenarthrobacter ilicis]
MKHRLLLTVIAGTALVALTGCTSYTGIAAIQRAADARDDLPANVKSSDPDMPSNYRLLVEDADVRYLGAESQDHSVVCVAAVPALKPDQWVIGCSDGIINDREIVTVSHIGQPTVKLVTDNFDTQALESEGWRKIHSNVLVGRVLAF